MEYGGPDYFDEDRSSPFRYCMVLCCCQRFGDAIAHLWHCNKLLPAAHLAAAALHYGLVLPYAPLDMNPAHPMVMGARSINGASYGASQQDPTPATVLQFFTSTPLLQGRPAVAVDYLMSLDSNWLAHAQHGMDAELKEALKLKSQAVVSGVLEAFITVLSREQLQEVVGEPADFSGSGGRYVSSSSGGWARTGGRLDDYLGASQVELLLTRSAYHMLTQRREPEAAIHLYLLAGRYAEVLQELCSQLVGVLIPQVTADRSIMAFGGSPRARSQQQRVHSHEVSRAQWRTMGEHFIEQYLQVQEGNSVVLKSLTQSGDRALVDSLLLLNGLFAFVDAVYSNEGSPAQALRMLDQLQVLPAAEEQVDVCAASSSSAAADPSLRHVLDDVLVMAMECTATAYHAAQLERARSNAASSSSAGGAGSFAGLLTDRDLQIQALKRRANALASFAVRIKTRLNRQDTTGILARMEAAIV